MTKAGIDSAPIGFIGLGLMGQPMSLNLVRAGRDVVVWNRNPERARELEAAGAEIAANVAEVFAKCRAVILMLASDQAVDEVLGRGSPQFSDLVRGRIVIPMGTHSPDYSVALGTEVQKAGGHYVEAPVSGSVNPAREGNLVGMLAGEAEAVAEVRSLIGPLCKTVIVCGSPGAALRAKAAVNIFQQAALGGLAEALHFAKLYELNLDALAEIILSGPMASDLIRLKLPKMTKRDFSAQAAATDAHKSMSIVADAVRRVGAATPYLDLTVALYGETVELGNGQLDLSAIITAIEARTERSA